MRRFLSKFFILSICFVPAFDVQARPVSYPGGYTVMFMNDDDANAMHLHYSPSAKYSLGYRFEHQRDEDYELHALQGNILLKRWNNPASQANFYLKSGIGFADGSDDGSLAGFVGIAADWEDRRFFTSYENRIVEAGDVDSFFMQHARAGVAPYVGDYGDLHTWFMVQVHHTPKDEDKVTVTPLVRFFKDVHLLEAGISNQGKVLFNYVIRY